VSQRCIAICAYFNFAEDGRRAAAYATFRAGMEAQNIPVLCVEQTFPGVPRVSPPADIVVAAGDRLWQLESLLQIGIDHALARGFEYVIVGDADIVFDTPHALDRILASLQDYDFVQPFESVLTLYSDIQPTRPSSLSFPASAPLGAGHPGSCWAGTRAFFEAVRLYPFALLGGGDVVITHIARNAQHYGVGSERLAEVSRFVANRILYPELLPSIMRWAGQFEHRDFRFGWTPEVRLRSLDHGSFAGRKYLKRYAPWQGTADDARGPRPGRDFDVGAAGLLEWLLPNESWKTYVDRFFLDRAASS